MNIQFSNVQVVRMDSRLHISWGSDAALGKVTIYCGLSPLNADRQVDEAEGAIGTMLLDDPNPGRRTYFVLKSEYGGARTAAERRLPLQGMLNFRDLGGYETTDGRYVQWGVLFRSEELFDLTVHDRLYLEDCGVKTVCDYRAEYEAELRPNPSFGNIVQIRVPIKVETERHRSRMSYMEMIDQDKLHILGSPGDMLIYANRRYVSHFAKSFSTLFELLLTPGHLPLVQHCAAGKDRTGFGSAIVLLALGVPEETIMEDYLLTNKFREETDTGVLSAIEPKLKRSEDRDVVLALLQARREYLQAALDEIRSSFGSVDRYLEEAVGLTMASRRQLQNMLLTDT